MKPEDDPQVWCDLVRREASRLGRKLTLKELLKLSRSYRMTRAEIEAQRQSWARQDKD